MKNNPLLDIDFLTQLDQQKQKQLYAKIISLTVDELPIEEITGKVTGGSINIDGTSAIRRSCSVSLVALNVNINDYYWGVNTKFQLFIGVENNIDDQYEKIIWFKQGIFLITSFNTSLQLNGYNISIQGKDKMCLLNGDIAGTINSLTVDFGKYDQYDKDGNVITRDYIVREIIKEAVHQYAKEPYGNIIIKDLDTTGLELMEYRGDTDLFLLIKDDIITGYKFAEDNASDSNSEYYLYKINNQGDPIQPTEQIALENILNYDPRISKQFGEELAAATKITTLEQYNLNPAAAWTVARIHYGDTCGYRETELTYPKDLIANVGESITSSLLDKIVQMLGEYEYFYDVDGHFIFQRKATYNDNSWNSIQNLGDPDNLYVENAVYTSALTYSFLDSNLITAFQNTPNLTNLKNDFAIWGTKKSGDNEVPIHLRYAIDDKPKYYKSFSGKVYITLDEYNKLRQLNALEDSESTIIISNESLFKITPLPEGLSNGWWEIDDWTRRYLYFADVNEDRGMTIDDYIHLTGQEVYDIVNPITTGSDPGEEVHDFNYYVYKLKYQLGTFAKKWATEDWLGVFPKPTEINNRYYNDIQNALTNNEDYWAWLIDTVDSPETGKEYIQSIEHGWVITPAGELPPENREPGCTHSFSFALGRKRGRTDYHVYIYDPDIPDSLKDDTSFIEKETKSNITIMDNNYFICDWREIIYQMAYDYYHYQHNDNYTATLAKNNKNYYPDGFTKYEQYYIDIYSFWRDIYNPSPQGLNTHVVDISKDSLYLWDNNKEDFEELPLSSTANVRISIPKDVVAEDGEFYYVTGRNKYTPYLVYNNNQNYYVQKLYKDLSKIKYDPSKIYIEENRNGQKSIYTNTAFKRVYLTQSSYRVGKVNEGEDTIYYYKNNNNQIVADNEYVEFTFTDDVHYTPNKYYYLDARDGKYKIDTQRQQTVNRQYYVKNKFDENKEYYEKSIYFTIGHKYYLGDSWQKVNNFGAGIQYYTQNYFLKTTENGKYNKDSEDNIFRKVATNGKYKKVDSATNKTEVGYTEDLYIDPTIQYFDYLTTSSMNIYSKVDSFLKGKRYYYEKLVPGDGEKSFYVSTANTWTTSYNYGQKGNGEIILYKSSPSNLQDMTFYMINSTRQNSSLPEKYAKTYEYDENVVLELNKAYFIKQDASVNEILDLTDGRDIDYYYNNGFDQGLITNSGNYLDKESRVIKGSIMKFFPGDVYNQYYKENNENIQNGYYFLQEQYYYLSTSAMFSPSNTYYSDIYGTVAALTNNTYSANKYYLKGTNSQKMFTKRNILYEFKKGFDYYIIENENNKSLIFERNYLLATFYPRPETIFYELIGKDFIPRIFDTEEDFNNRNKDYYIAYGKYNYYYYTDFILNKIIFLKEVYNVNDIYYKKENNKTLKQNYVGSLSEDEWRQGDYYTISSEIHFKKSSSYDSNKTYYILPSLESPTISNLEEEDWSDDLFELENQNGIYISQDFNIKTYWSSLTKTPELLIFWFDFLDISTGGELAQYSAHLIGDRPKSVNDKDVRSIYYRDIPTVIFKDNNSAYIKIFINEEKFNAKEEDYFVYDNINDKFIKVVAFDNTQQHYIIKQDGTTTDIGSENYYDTINMYVEDGTLTAKYEPTEDYYRKWNYSEDGKTGYTYVNLTSNINNLFSVSTQKKSTFDILDNFLYNNSYCTETISITAIPIYHLSPNTRIFVRDDKTGINGEYIVSKISLPLTYNGTMNISATKAVKRIY